jgi:hypothetical protein
MVKQSRGLSIVGGALRSVELKSEIKQTVWLPVNKCRIAWDPKKAKEGKLKKGTSKKYADMQENLHVNGEGYVTPSHESFLHDLEVDPSSVLRGMPLQ